MTVTTFIYGLYDPRDNQLRYVGKANNPERRLDAHIREAKLEKRGQSSHKNNWLRKLLKNNLYPVLKILEEVDAKNWKKHEITWIETSRKNNTKLVNSTVGGEGVKGHKLTEEHKRKLGDSHKGQIAWNKGKHHSDETKEKIRLANTGKKRSDELRRKISLINKGRKRTEEFKENVRARNKGQKASEETKEKLRQASLGNKYSLGYKHTEETRKKMSESHKGKLLTAEHKEKLGNLHRGKIVSEETRKRMSMASKGRVPHNKGKPHSEETRKKISEANRRYWASKKVEKTNE